MRANSDQRSGAHMATHRVDGPVQETAIGLGAAGEGFCALSGSKSKGSADLLKDVPRGTEVETVAKITIENI